MNFGELFVQLGAIGNSKEVKAFGEAVKKAGKAIDDFDKKQNKTEDGSKKLNNSFGKSALKLLGVVSALAMAYTALDRLTESLAKQNQQWLNLINTSDLAYNTFQKWDNIGKILGIEGVGQQLQDLEQKIFNLKLTGEGGDAFAFAGIMPTSSEDVLEQLRQRVSGLSNAQATYILQKMGLNPQLLTLLRATRSEWDEYTKSIRKFTLTEDQARNVEKLNRELNTAKLRFKYLKDSIIMALMPAFVKLTNAMAFVAGKFANFVNWLSQSQSVGAKTARVILGIATALGAVRIALMAITAHPIVAAITLILGALFALWNFIEDLVDDIQHYKNGGGSLIGVIAKGLEDLDIQGIIDFPVPKWLEYMIKFIDFWSGHATDRAVKVRIQEMVDDLDPSGNTIQTADGGYASVPPEFLTSQSNRAIRGSVTNNTSTDQSVVNNVNMKVDINTTESASAVQREFQNATSRGARK